MDLASGVLRVYGALGTDRYPPFTLELAVVDGARRREPQQPPGVRELLGALARTTEWAVGGLVGLLTLVAAVALLFTGRYPQGLLDVILGLDRWVLRVAAYVGLLTDAYPPLRLDLGGGETASASINPRSTTGQGMRPPPAPTSATPKPPAAQVPGRPSGS